MSRFFVTRGGSIVHEKRFPKPYTEAWMQAREERFLRRHHRTPEQPRNERAFIVKKQVVVGLNGRREVHEILYDPGPIDRELYLSKKKERDNARYDAPNA